MSTRWPENNRQSLGKQLCEKTQVKQFEYQTRTAEILRERKKHVFPQFSWIFYTNSVLDLALDNRSPTSSLLENKFEENFEN